MTPGAGCVRCWDCIAFGATGSLAWLMRWTTCSCTKCSLTSCSYAAIVEILPRRRRRTFDLEVDELHNLVAEGVVVHNCSPPFKQAEFDILYGHGISREGSLIDVGVEQAIVRKSGAWYTYEGDQLGQGKENARTFLLENPDIAAEVEKKIKEKLGIGAQLDADDQVPPAPVDF